MIRHAMTYVQRLDNVQEDRALAEAPYDREFYEVRRALVKAEGELVRAYRDWRALMKKYAAEGNKLAARYVEESTWDLT